MQTRESRFLAVATILDPWGNNEDREHHYPAPGVSHWDFYQRPGRAGHPIDDHKIAMAVGKRGSVIGRGASDPLGLPRLLITAMRTGAAASSIELTAGIYIYHSHSQEHRHLMMQRADCGGLFPTIDRPSAPAYHGTLNARVKWPGSGTKPSVAFLRCRPMVGLHNRTLIAFTYQMPANWDDGSSTGVQAESVFSGATADIGNGKVVLGLPFVHAYDELLFDLTTSGINHVVTNLKSLVRL